MLLLKLCVSGQVVACSDLSQVWGCVMGGGGWIDRVSDMKMLKC